MHEVVKDELERHLTGKASAAFYSHLDVCVPCREAVDEMNELSIILRGLGTSLGDAPRPGLGFYSKVASTIREQQPTSPFAGLFSPSLMFFRKVAFASLILLTGLGSLLINNEVSQDGADATAMMAQYDPSTSHAGAAEPDRLLVTLAAWHE